MTVIVPCRNERRYIAACLDSILATAYPADRIEVLVVDGASDDGTRDVLRAYAEREPRVRLLDNPRRSAPAALNIGIRAATGEIIARMDAHVVYPPQYLPVLVRALLETGADNVGCPIVTLPADESATARAIACALSHPFGVGNSWFRIGTAVRREVDTVPFGCFRRDVFDRVGTFDEELVRNQDDEFNFRLIRSGGRVLLVPDVAAQYYARGSLRHVARMYYQYGWYKPLVARKVGRIMTARQLAPGAFVAALAALTLLAVAWPAAGVALAALLAAYAAADLAAALTARVRLGLRARAVLALVFPLIHFGYGLGSLAGAAYWLLRPRRRAPAAEALPLSR